jgi:hypothetical protein
MIICMNYSAICLFFLRFLIPSRKILFLLAYSMRTSIKQSGIAPNIV